MQYLEFNTDFIKRTIKIVEQYEGEYDVTLFINCLVGLLLLPKEKFFDRLPDKDIKDLDDTWGIKQDQVEVRCTCCGYKLKNVVRQLRNGVAHMRISTQKEDGKIAVVQFKDTNFKAEIPVKDLKIFALKLAAYILELE